MKKMTRKLPLLALLILVLLASCGKSDKKEIEEVFQNRKKAFETKNLELYLSCISPNYRDKKKGEIVDIEKLKEDFIESVSTFDQIRLFYSDRTIYPKEDRAEVIQKIVLEVSLNGEQVRLPSKERITLEKIGDRWKIVKGL